MKGLLKALIWIVVLASIAYLIGWAFLFVSHTSTDNAMAPNLIRGDRYLVYTRTGFHHGAVAVCEHPRELGVKVVGRIVGMGDDKVRIERGQVRLNGQQLKTTGEGAYVLVDDADASSPLTQEMSLAYEEAGMNRYKVLNPQRGRVRDMREVTVPAGEFFLLADNRATGEDSRSFGTVRASGCVGRPLIIYNPGPSAGDATRGGRWFDFVR